MLAEKLPQEHSELPTRPFGPRPAGFEAVAPIRTHLMLVRAPRPTPRALAWARREALAYDALGLERMLRFERLNLG